MSKSSNLTAPYLGMRDNIPIAALKSPFCQSLLNFNVTQSGISLRKADSTLTNLTVLSANGLPLKLSQYNNQILLALMGNTSTNKTTIVDGETNTVVYTASNASAQTPSFFELSFNNYLFFLSPDRDSPGLYYNGTSYGAIGYTGSGLAPIGGAVFKNRAYLVQKSEAAYWYSGIDAVSGSLTKVDLSSVITSKGSLSIIAPITLSDNISAVTLLSFVFSTGEVLFYSGSYPDADDWSLEGRATIGPPLSSDSFVSFQGDTLVSCDTGVVGLRDLFLQGSLNATNLTINSNIQASWRTLVAAMRSYTSIYPPNFFPFGVFSIYDTSKSRIIFFFPYYLDSNGTIQSGNTMYVFDAIQKAWSIHRSAGVTYYRVDATVYKNAILMLQGSGLFTLIAKKEGSTGYADLGTSGYDFEMIDAPIPFPKTAVYETTQIEPIIKSDLYAETNWNLVADFGRQTSGSQTTNAPTTAVQKPAVNVGMQNITYVQVKMSGTTVTGKTVGLDLYSYNVWYDSGPEGSR